MKQMRIENNSSTDFRSVPHARRMDEGYRKEEENNYRPQLQIRRR